MCAKGEGSEGRDRGNWVMAFYHLSAKMIGRSTGRSSVAAAAYRSGSRLRDERTGRDHDYTRKGGVEHSEIVAPGNAPAWMHDRSALWNAVERVEKRRDAQLAREIELGLPREVAAERRADVVREFVQSEFVGRGMIADFAIHNGRARDGGEQPHAHVMLTTRELMGEGFGKKEREWNGADKLEGWRARWAEHVNRELERDGHEARVDHRRLDVQRAEAERDARKARDTGDEHAAAKHDIRAADLDREPEPKLGPIASQMEKLGHPSRRGDERRAVEARNAERRVLHEEARELAKQIAEATRQAVDVARRHVQELGKRLETAYQAIRHRAETALAKTETADRVVEGSKSAEVVAKSMNNALLGRMGPPGPNAANIVDRDALLGRKNRERDAHSSTPDKAILLGRGEPRQAGNESQDRDDGDRSR